MDSGSIITWLLASVIIGYGTYVLFNSLRKQAKGDCSSCSYGDEKNCNCSSSPEK